MGSEVYFNGVELEGITNAGEVRNSRSTPSTIPRRHGAYGDPKLYLEPRPVHLKGIIIKDTAAALQTALDELNAIIEADRAPLQLHADRFLWAQKESFSYDFIDGFACKGITYDLSFICYDPFYYALDTVSQDITLTGSADQASSVALIDAVPTAIAGNADCESIITITPSATYTSIIIINQHPDIVRQFSFILATGASGDEIIINTVDKLCYCNGLNALSSFYGSFFLLRAGEINPLLYNGPAGTMNIEYRPRWY